MRIAAGLEKAKRAVEAAKAVEAKVKEIAAAAKAKKKKVEKTAKKSGKKYNKKNADITGKKRPEDAFDMSSNLKRQKTLLFTLSVTQGKDKGKGKEKVVASSSCGIGGQIM